MFCWVGWHVWTKWSEPQKAELLGGGMVFVQQRTCKDCGLIQHRWV